MMLGTPLTRCDKTEEVRVRGVKQRKEGGLCEQVTDVA